MPLLISSRGFAPRNERYSSSAMFVAFLSSSKRLFAVNCFYILPVLIFMLAAALAPFRLLFKF